MEKAIRASEMAQSYFRNNKYFCAEAVLKSILEVYDYPMREEIVKFATGFSGGVGREGCICGAISGGVLCLGMFFGRYNAGDPAGVKAIELTAKLYERFTEKHKHTCCRILTRKLEKGTPERLNQCLSLIGEIAYETVCIIEENKESRII